MWANKLIKDIISNNVLSGVYYLTDEHTVSGTKYISMFCPQLVLKIPENVSFDFRKSLVELV